MPGLNQLKKFSEDILQLGNEPERRRAKGEALLHVTFPENASEADDSSQFLLGLPQEGDVISGAAGEGPAPDENEEIDIDALLANALGDQNAQPPAPEPAVAEPEIPEVTPDAAAESSIPSLDDDIFGDISDFSSSGALDALAEFEADSSDLFSDPAIDDLTAPEPLPAEDQPVDLVADEPVADFGGLDDLGDFSLDAEPVEAEPVELAEAEPVEAESVPDFDFAQGTDPVLDIDSLEDTASAGDTTGGFDDFSFGADDIASTDSAAAADSDTAFSSMDDEFAISGDTPVMDMNADLPESLNEGPSAVEDPFAGMGELDFSSDSSDTGAADVADLNAADDAGGLDDFALDTADSGTTDGGDFDLGGADLDLGGTDFGGDFDLGSGDDVGASTDGDVSTLDEVAELEDADSGDFSLSDTPEPADEFGGIDSPATDSGDTDFSMPDFDLGGDGGDSGSSESFDLPPVDGLDAMDFSMDSGSGTEESSSDDEFAIPGFSDFDMMPQEDAPSKPTETKTTAKQKDEPPPLKTELTDSEYKTFLENLDYYPLNVRIALQDMIVKNEFTDDAVMDVIHKVLKKIPARQLAAHLEKLLDISLPVPVNYEKRTAAEYEAYKQSLAYQLRNKIIPIAIASFFSLLLCTLFGWLIAKFVVTPVKAELLYKEGYELISNGMYPQSEQKFNEATSYKAKKKWFFTYARSYKEARQYDRSAGIYQRLLNRFEHDKTAGLEYANMELYDRSNYQRAEEVVRREILDYHIDDPDGMLLLGDVFLEWATNTDPAKFDDALYAYEDLMYVHGQTDLHLSRMLRYYMRTDQIKRVLELKSYFYPRMAKKQVMENKDQVELAGYMLDKMFGYLSPKDEYLRAYIEDVRDLLEIAIKSCEKSGDTESYPEAVYNYGRYFVETTNPDSAETVLKRAVELLGSAEKKSHSRTLKNINAYRLLGEIYTNNKKYIDAETMYAEGLTLFEYEKKNNGLEPDENVGLLYADMADIDYFLSGDYDAALRNYEAAINNLNDTPSIRYRVGWIQYANGNYSEALGSFIKVITDKPSEKNALFALGNTLAFRNSTAAAAGYYEKLLDELDLEIQRADVSLTRVQDIDQEELFTLYMKVTNNLGVALSQFADQTSDSRMNAKAISQFSNSIQAYDALHRNPETYIRLTGSNLAEMNLKYLTVPGSTYEPEYYPELSRVLTDELMLRQADE